MDFYSCIIIINCIRLKTFWRFLGPKKCRNLVISGQIWLNFGFKKVIYWLGHSVPIKSSTVNDIICRIDRLHYTLQLL